MSERYWRDSSDRLTFDLPQISAIDYPAVCREIAAAFELTAGAPPVVGPDQMFWDFRTAGGVVGLDWDIWMGLMVVAKTADSESLVREIAAWLAVSPWANELKSR